VNVKSGDRIARDANVQIIATELEENRESVNSGSACEHTIDSEIELTRPVTCDSPRNAHLFSNLLVNALTHGHPSGPVGVYACSGDSGFELAVTNCGKPIPLEASAHLFQPFSRNSVRPGQRGLGLGLFIAAEIAQAHLGSMTVASSSAETRFTFHMPLQA
jgi:signal transduction histidine kinase